eukprot:3422186-Lingulodinium_polyedra.AAC.1
MARSKEGPVCRIWYSTGHSTSSWQAATAALKAFRSSAWLKLKTRLVGGRVRRARDRKGSRRR